MVGSSSGIVTGIVTGTCIVVLLGSGLRLLVAAGRPGIVVAMGLMATVAAVAAAPALADLTGLPLPDRTTGSSSSASGSRSGTSSAGALRAGGVVVVRRGESLWTISVGLLGGRRARTSDALVTQTWHRLHRANRARIGRDPDLILPGTRLVVPAPQDAS